MTHQKIGVPDPLHERVEATADGWYIPERRTVGTGWMRFHRRSTGTLIRFRQNARAADFLAFWWNYDRTSDTPRYLLQHTPEETHP